MCSVFSLLKKKNNPVSATFNLNMDIAFIAFIAFMCLAAAGVKSIKELNSSDFYWFTVVSVLDVCRTKQPN